MSAGDVLLIRFAWSAAAASAVQRDGVDLLQSLAGDQGYAYAGEPAAVAHLRGALAGLPGGSHAVLAPLLDLPGASAGAAAPFHYVVETDIPPEHEADFNAWYETEHMPGLARVPGTVRARRFRNDAGHPRYHACYDLLIPETLGSPLWLAVRATAWSDRVRPHFRNTRRTMFRRLGHASPP